MAVGRDGDVVDLSPPPSAFPEPRPDTANAEPTKEVRIAVLENDGGLDILVIPSTPDSLFPLFNRVAAKRLVRVTQPAHGTAALNADGTVSYRSSSAVFWGKDEFTYTVVNKSGLAATTTVTVFVGPKFELKTTWPFK